MKIGILTFWGTKNNYGQVLQCYALYKTLCNLGHNPVLVKYDKLDRDVPDTPHPSGIQVPAAYLRKLLSRFYHYLKENRHFSSFYKKQIHSIGPYSIAEIRKTKLPLDLLIAGSDQIWSCDWPFLFADFAYDIPCMAYSASFGGTSFTDSVNKRLRVWLSRFKYISVREVDGIEICKKLGRDDAMLLPDPTLLLSCENYISLCSRIPKKNKKYILLYWLGNETAFDINLAYQYANKRNLEIVLVTAQHYRGREKETYPSIEEWIALIRDATFVVTNSFHGTVFSVLLKKRFLSIPLSGKHSRMNGRIATFLNKNRHKAQRKAKFYINKCRSASCMQSGLKQASA